MFGADIWVEHEVPSVVQAALFVQHSSSPVLKPEARCTPISSLHDFWDGAARLECVALQALLRLETTAVQGEILLPSVTAVASAANVDHLNAGPQCCCHKTLFVPVVLPSERTRAASHQNGRKKLGVSKTDGKQPACPGVSGGIESPRAFPLAEVSLWTSVPHRGVSLPQPAPVI